MEFIKKKIVIVGLKNLDSIEHKEAIVVTTTSARDVDTQKDLDYKFDFFILSLIKKEDEVVGLVGIDKLMGDITAIQFEKIILDEDSKYFAKKIGIDSLELENKSSISDEEFKALCEKFLANFRVIPDLEKILAAKRQLQDFLQRNPSEIEKRNFLETLSELIERNKIENYDDRTNVYAIIEQVGLEKSIFTYRTGLGVG